KDSRLVDALFPGFPNGTGHAHDATAVVSGLTDRWAQLTGQPQDWALFAPNVGNQVPFLAAELRWDDAPPGAPGAAEVLRSENEPADINHSFRVGLFRLRRYEGTLDTFLFIPEGKTADDMWDQLRGQIEKHVRRKWPEIGAYLRRRARTFLR